MHFKDLSPDLQALIQTKITSPASIQFLAQPVRNSYRRTLIITLVTIYLWGSLGLLIVDTYAALTMIPIGLFNLAILLVWMIPNPWYRLNRASNIVYILTESHIYIAYKNRFRNKIRSFSPARCNHIRCKKQPGDTMMTLFEKSSKRVKSYAKRHTGGGRGTSTLKTVNGFFAISREDAETAEKLLRTLKENYTQKLPQTTPESHFTSLERQINEKVSRPRYKELESTHHLTVETPHRPPIDDIQCLP